MGTKRKTDDATEGHNKTKKQRGFNVGPANLPDGTWKRKNQKIKHGLVERAHIKKKYAQLKKQSDLGDRTESLPMPASLAVDHGAAADGQDEHDHTPAVTTEPPSLHPDRQLLVERQENIATSEAKPAHTDSRPRRQPRHVPFKQELADVEARRQERERLNAERAEARRQQEEKRAIREKHRRAMAKARTGGANGQRKLGRESTILLDRVKQMMGQNL